MQIIDQDLRVLKARRAITRPGADRIARLPGSEGPLSFPQTRLAFLQYLDPQSSHYNMPFALRVAGSLDLGALRESLRVLIRRHAVLRTGIHLVNGEPVQRIRAEIEPDLIVHDLRSVLEAALSQRISAPFDLASGRMLRTDVFQLPSRETLVLINTHHIASDGWSLGILLAELSAAYTAIVECGRPPDLPEPPIRYLDFAAWQRQQDAEGHNDLHYAYWERRLSDMPDLAELLLDRPRPESAATAGGAISLPLEHSLARALADFSREEGATQYVISLAAFAVTLARLSGETAVSVGTPTASRTRPETMQLVGCFVNTLVMPLRIDETATFREMARTARSVVSEAQSHQDVPYERLVERLQPSRQFQRAALFQVMFSFESADAIVDDIKFGPHLARAEPLPHETAKFDLTVSVVRAGGDLSIVAEYGADVFERCTVERLCEHYREVLSWVLCNPDRRLLEFPVVVGGRMTSEPSARDSKRPRRRSNDVITLIRRWALTHPDATALDGEEALSYAELMARVDRLAVCLARHGVSSGDVVGLLMGRRIPLIVAMLAVLRLNAVFLTLDAEYPAQRLTFMLRDSRCRCLLRQGGLRADLEFDETVLDYDRLGASGDGECVALAATRGRAAAIVYTSGSTGDPKGVVLPIDGLLNHALRMARCWALERRDRVLQFNSPGFDAFLEEVFCTLVAGACLTVPAQKPIHPKQLCEYVAAHRITLLDLPTAYWHALTYRLDEQLAAALRSVRSVTTGGEAASMEAVRRWFRYCPSVPWINSYGPTEATICVLTHTMAGAPGEGDFPWGPPLGRELAGSRVHVLDGWLRPAPVNAPGQLYIEGEGLAFGYLGRPGLTAERFVPNPCGARGSRLYATGDICRYDNDGNLLFIGRTDRQVKLNGFRIELSEIEKTLLSHGSVTNVATGMHRRVDRADYVYACVATRGSTTEQELVSFLRTRLPAYMMPARVLVTDTIPLTVSGKVDHAAISRIVASGAGQRAYVAPRTAFQKIVGSLWEEQFGVERIGLEDEFFAIGGHSIAAIRLGARIEEIFGIEVALATIFSHPALEDFCDVVQRTSGDPDAIEHAAQLLVAFNTGADAAAQEHERA